MIIKIQNKQSKIPLDPRKMRATLRAILLALKLPEVEVSLLLVDSLQMSDLNGRFLKRKGPTDVLSFPAAVHPKAAKQVRHLGDIAICPQVVHAYAKRHKRIFRDELAHDMIHGVLHLLGYDHLTKKDARLMRNQEKKLLPVASLRLRGVFLR